MTDLRKTPLPPPSSPVDAFLKQLERAPVVRPSDRKGRLIFGMDATASREATWREARKVQADMFQVAADSGGLDIQLCHYQGLADFSVSPWLSDADDLRRQMMRVECLGGLTQIGRLLEHAIGEAKHSKINALVFVGDCMEENVDHLCALAGRLALLNVKAFIFQEGCDPEAERAFRQIARLTGGAHCRFDAGSAGQLRDLLSAVAAYAAGGLAALQNFGRQRGGLATQLIQHMQSP
jgi:hypothetical protein